MFKTWLCVVCGLIYDEAKGWPQDGIAAGTRWEDVPADWLCPECGVGKSDFEMLDVSEVVAAVSEAPVPVPPTFAQPQQPIVIIGSGHAGYGLAQALRKADDKVEIIVITRECGHLYSKPALSIGLVQGKSIETLSGEAPFAIEKRLNISVRSFCEVQRIDTATKTLHTNLGDLAYGQLVLASGAEPIRLPIDGNREAIVSVNNLEDYKAFRSALVGKRRIAILGDGLIGCEFANDLAASGFEVSVIGLGRWPMERLLPQEVGAQLQNALQAQGVRWHLQNTLKRVDKTDAGYRLLLADGAQLEADIVLSAVGLRPSVALAERAGLAIGRGIQVDDHMRTSQPGVFALGDCIEIDGQLLPYLAPINQGVQALSRTLLGQPTRVSYPHMPIIVKTPAAPLSVLPPASGCEGDWKCTATTDGMSAGFYDTQGHLRGFVLLGKEAQTQRNAWLQSCHTTDRAVA